MRLRNNFFKKTVYGTFKIMNILYKFKNYHFIKKLDTAYIQQLNNICKLYSYNNKLKLNISDLVNDTINKARNFFNVQN